MKFRIKESSRQDFIIGLAMLVAGLFIFVRKIYVATPFTSTGINLGGVCVNTGIFTLPLIAGLVWMFLSPKKKLPRIISAIGLALVIMVTILSVSIRVAYIPLALWAVILVLIIGGGIMILRAVRLGK